jgi:hypothetical protein
MCACHSSLSYWKLPCGERNVTYQMFDENGVNCEQVVQSVGTHCWFPDALDGLIDTEIMVALRSE